MGSHIVGTALQTEPLAATAVTGGQPALVGGRQIVTCSEQDPCMRILPFSVSLGIRSSHLKQVQSRVDRAALISTFLLGILSVSWHATQEEAGSGGRAAVCSDRPSVPGGTELQPACGKRASRTFRYPERVITQSRYFTASLTLS